MLRAKILVGVLRNLINVVSIVEDQVIVVITKRGFAISEVDKRCKLLVTLSMPSDSFEKYDIFGDREMVIGLNIGQLGKLLSGMENEEVVEMEIDDETRNMHIKAGFMSYELKLFDPKKSNGVTIAPNVDSTVTTLLESSKFKNAIGNAEKISDKATICIRRNAVLVEASNKDEIMRHIFFIPDDPLTPKTSLSKESKAVFSVNYLRKITKNFGRSKLVDIVLEDGILKISFKVHNAQVEYYLAAES